MGHLRLAIASFAKPKRNSFHAVKAVPAHFLERRFEYHLGNSPQVHWSEKTHKRNLPS
jgi:hypothetical protein